MKKTFKGSSFCNGAGGTNFHIGFCLRSIKGLKVPFWANCAIPSIWQRFSWEWGSGGPFRLRVRCGGGGGCCGLGGVGPLFVVCAWGDQLVTIVYVSTTIGEAY